MDDKTARPDEIGGSPGEATSPATSPATDAQGDLPSPAQPTAPPAEERTVAATTAGTTATAGRGGRGAAGVGRSVAVGLFFVLTCLSLALAVTTSWLHQTVLDTDSWVALTAPLVHDPAVTDALATATSNQIEEALDLGPVAGLVVSGVTRQVYSSDAFASAWETVMRVVHEQLVRVLRGETNVAQVVDGMLVLNLFPFIDRILDTVRGLNLELRGQPVNVPDISNPTDPDASRAELGAALGRQLKPTFGVIPIAEVPKLEAAQRLVTLFDSLVVVLWAVTVLLAVVTVALARRRLRMVALLGLGGLAALLAARLLVASAADGIATALAEGGPGAVIGAHVVVQVANDYRETGRVILFLGLAVAVVATVAAWYLERRATAAEGRPAAAAATGPVDGWFLALLGLCVVLGGLLVVGLSALTAVVAVVLYVAWIGLVVWWGRRAAAPVGVAPAPSA